MEVAEDAEYLRARLRLSNDEHERLLRTAVRADIGPSVPEPAARAYLYAAGMAAYREHVVMAWARSGDPVTHALWRARLALPERWSPPAFAIGGADVMALGVPTGPRVGEILRALEAWWIDGDFTADKAGLHKKLGELAAAPAGGLRRV